MCNGYVGADLAAMASLRRNMQGIHHEFGQGTVKMQDWQHAHLKVGPSIVRGAVVEVPKVLWEDIGGLKEVKV